MARGCSDAGDCTDQRQQDQNDRQHGRTSHGAGRVVQNLHDWNSRWRIQHVVDVAEAEAKRDEHDQTQKPVEKGRPHHGGRKHAGGVLELLSHVSSRIGSEEAPQRGGDADEAGKSHVAPSASVGKLREHLTGRGMVAHDPQRDQKGEETDNVQNQKNPLGQRQLAREKKR